MEESTSRTKIVTKVVESEHAKADFLPTFEKQVEEFKAHVERMRNSDIERLLNPNRCTFAQWTLQKTTLAKVWLKYNRLVGPRLQLRI